MIVQNHIIKYIIIYFLKYSQLMWNTNTIALSSLNVDLINQCDLTLLCIRRTANKLEFAAPPCRWIIEWQPIFFGTLQLSLFHLNLIQPLTFLFLFPFLPFSNSYNLVLLTRGVHENLENSIKTNQPIKNRYFFGFGLDFVLNVITDQILFDFAFNEK